jgi:hypothetical protein
MGARVNVDKGGWWGKREPDGGREYDGLEDSEWWEDCVTVSWFVSDSTFCFLDLLRIVKPAHQQHIITSLPLRWMVYLAT